MYVYLLYTHIYMFSQLLRYVYMCVVAVTDPCSNTLWRKQYRNLRTDTFHN